MKRRRWLMGSGAVAAKASLASWLMPVRARAQPAAATPGPAVADATREAAAPALPAAGAALALPAALLLDGRNFEPRDADGRVGVIYWWASWCPFCAIVSPMIDRLWLEQRGRGLVLLTFSIDRRAEDAAAYLQRRGYAWPTAWVTPQLHAAFPKPRGLPVTLVRGRDGRVLQAEAGQLFPEDVQAMARHL